MADAPDIANKKRSLSLRLLYVLSVIMVLIGLVNSTPGIAGYDDLVARLLGQDRVQFCNFSF